MDRILMPIAIALITIATAGSSGCNRGGNPAGAGQSGAGPPAVEVSVAEATAKSIIDYREFTGRTAAVNSVEIRPRVSGYLLQTPRSDGNRPDRETIANESLPNGSDFHAVIPPQDAADDPENTTRDTTGKPRSRTEQFIVMIQEGDRVEQGEPLFEIDPEPYRLAYFQAVGNLKSARAQLTKARQDLARQKELLPRQAVSRAEYDATVASVAEAVGNIEMLKATVDRAYIDWNYTQLRSPISGLVGRAQITRGNLAVEDTTVLTSVVTTDPIYVYFDIDENTVLDYRSRIQQGSVESARDTTIDVELALANEKGFPHQGVIDFVNNTTNPDTGNTLLRARFANPDDLISPGLFARIRAPFTAPYDAVLIPTLALGADQQGRFVMLVDEKNQVRRQPVTLGTKQGELTVIRTGLAAGDRVVVSGLQRVQNGVKVKVVAKSDQPAESVESAVKSAVKSDANTAAEPAH